MGRWTDQALPLSSMTQAWVGDFGRIFVDSGWMGRDVTRRHLGIFALLIALNAAAAVLVLCSLWFLWRNASRQEWLFIIVLIATTSLPLIGADLVLGRQASTAGRYLLPAYLGLQLAVSYLLAATMKTAAHVWYRKLWQQLGIVLILSGVISCAFMSQAEVWWNHSHVYHHPSMARIINRSSQALLISDGDQMDLLSLSYLLNSQTRFQLVGNDVPVFPDADRDIFLFMPSEPLRKRLGRIYELDLVHKGGGLWRVKKLSQPLLALGAKLFLPEMLESGWKKMK
jgi:uncharacterized membrane protein